MGLFKHRYTESTDTMDNGAMLITLADPKSGPAEQFRTIRTNIHFMSVDRPLKTVAFTSSGSAMSCASRPRASRVASTTSFASLGNFTVGSPKK